MRIVNFEDNEMVFSDGSCIRGDHDQDCCEYNYADFDAAFSDKDKKLKFKSFKVKPKEEGFLVILKGVKGEKSEFNPKGLIKRWVPCYSDQNGWYTTNLVIDTINAKGKVEKRFDLSCPYL